MNTMDLEDEQEMEITYLGNVNIPVFTADMDARARLARTANLAVDTLVQVLVDPRTKESTRASTAQYVIDQSVGKAQQIINVNKVTTIVDFMRLVEERSRALQEVNPLLAPPRDEMDNLLEAMIPEKFTVGAKGGTHETESRSGLSTGTSESIQWETGTSET